MHRLFLFVVVLEAFLLGASALQSREINGKRMFVRKDGRALTRYELLEDSIDILDRFVHHGTQNVGRWRTKEYKTERANMASLDPNLVERVLDEYVPSFVWDQAEGAYTSLELMEMETARQASSYIQEASQPAKGGNMTYSTNAALPTSNSLGKHVDDESRFLDLHYTEDYAEFQSYCQPGIYQFYVCPIRILPTLVYYPSGEMMYQLGYGCNAWTNFPVDAFYALAKEIAMIVLYVLDIACSAIPTDIVFQYVGLVAKIPVCALKYAAIAIQYVLEAATTRGDFHDWTYHRYLQNFIWSEVMEIHREVKCKGPINMNLRGLGCNGQDDDCFKEADDCNEDNFYPEIYVPRKETNRKWFDGYESAISAMNQSGLCVDDCKIAQQSVTHVGSQVCRNTEFKISCVDHCDSETTKTVPMWVDLESPTITCSLGVKGFVEMPYGGKVLVDDKTLLHNNFLNIQYSHAEGDDCALAKMEINVLEAIGDTDDPSFEEGGLIDVIEEGTPRQVKVFVDHSLRPGQSWRWYQVEATVWDNVGRSAECITYYGINSNSKQPPEPEDLLYVTIASVDFIIPQEP